MDGPKISVIIPIYRVEQYLRKCVESVLAQTYHNMEVILVDDGSPDGCGKICDEYADREGSRALKQEFETLLQGALETSAEISVCGHWEEYRGRREVSGWQELRVLDTEQALGELLENGRMKNLLWDRIFHRTLFDGLRFPEGRTYEDIAVMHWLFLRAEKVACLPEVLYHYRQREGSIVDNTSLGNRINHYIASKERYDALSEDWPQFRQLMEGQCVASAVGIWAGCLSNPRAVRKRYAPELQEIADFSAIHCQKALKYMDLGLAGRIALRLTPYNRWWAFVLAHFVAKLYKKKHGRTL